MSALPGLIPYRATPVLLYHQIAQMDHPEDRILLSIPPDRFRFQMKYLRDHGYTVVTLDELARIENGNQEYSAQAVAISFDDGYLDNYTNAFPILQEFGFSATVFLITDFVGKTHAWDACSPKRYLDWRHIKEMSRHGISFQSHTCTHPDLRKIEAGEAMQELTDSRKKIEDVLGKPVRHFAYPYGKYNDAVIRRVKEAGYLASYAAGMSERGSFARERFDVDVKDSPVLFSFMTSRWGSWIRTVRNTLFQPEWRKEPI